MSIIHFYRLPDHYDKSAPILCGIVHFYVSFTPNICCFSRFFSFRFLFSFYTLNGYQQDFPLCTYTTHHLTHKLKHRPNINTEALKNKTMSKKKKTRKQKDEEFKIEPNKFSLFDKSEYFAFLWLQSFLLIPFSFCDPFFSRFFCTFSNRYFVLIEIVGVHF